MLYQEYLNHKSILDCESEKDIERHNLDVQRMYEILEERGKFGAIVKIEYQNVAHKKKEPAYGLVSADGYFQAIEGLDMKNGGDFVIHNGDIGIAVYGQNYSYNDHSVHHGTQHMVEALATFHFFDSHHKDKAIELADYLDHTNDLEGEGYESLEQAYNKPYYLDTENLKQELRGVKRLSLDEQIEMADKEVQDKKSKKRQRRKTKEYEKDTER